MSWGITSFLQSLAGVEEVETPVAENDDRPSIQVEEDIKAGRIPYMPTKWYSEYAKCPKCRSFTRPTWHALGTCQKRPDHEHLHGYCSSGCKFEWAMPTRDAE